MKVLDGEGRAWGKAAASWLLAAACCFLLTTASHGHPSHAGTSAAAVAPFAIGDFDGDSRPDLATVRVGQISASNARYWINFELSAGSRQLIYFTAPVGGLEITTRDVNGDESVDLVVTTALLARPVAILLNDGHGKFTYRDAVEFTGIVWRFESGLRGANVDGKDAVAWTQSTTADKDGRSPPAVRLQSTELFAESSSIALKNSFLVFSGRAPPASGISL
jgi:hypothetical protein